MTKSENQSFGAEAVMAHAESVLRAKSAWIAMNKDEITTQDLKPSRQEGMELLKIAAIMELTAEVRRVRIELADTTAAIVGAVSGASDSASTPVRFS